jgi:hypothetical protein
LDKRIADADAAAVRHVAEEKAQDAAAKAKVDNRNDAAFNNLSPQEKNKLAASAAAAAGNIN